MKKSDELLKIIYNNKKWLTLPALADALHVCVKSIKNYKAEINLSFKTDIILSSKKGYCFNLEHIDSFRKVLEKREKMTSFTPRQRVSYLLQQLIKNGTLNLYDIAEELFVSTPTIEKDLREARKIAYNKQIEIQRNKEYIKLVCTESSLRQLTKRLIQKEAAYDFLSLQFIQEMIKSVDVTTINIILVKNIENSNFYINGYTVNSILLHLAISMDRFLSDSRILELGDVIVDKSLPEYSLSEMIINDLNTHFSIQLDDFEKINLFILLSSKVSSNSKSVLKDFLNGDIYEFISTSLNSIQKKYHLEEFSKDILLKLSLHCQNLIQRAVQRKMIANPLTNKIKSDYPFLFDISVDLSQKINRYFDICMSEDEITFITFHLGSYFEERRKHNNKLETILVAPKYYDMNQTLFENIQQDFEREISITSIIESYGMISKKQKEKFDFVITTVKNDLPSNGVLISPFYSNADHILVFNKIQAIHKAKKIEETKYLINQYFKPKLFEREQYFDSPEKYIEFMCKQLQDQDYVNKNFIEHVLAREYISSTAFNDFIAIPHSGELNANKTGIFVIHNEHSVTWGSHRVHTIMLICTSVYDSTMFKNMMDLIVSLYSDINKVQGLLNIQSFDEYLDEVMKILEFS